MIKKNLIGFIIVFCILGIGSSYAEWNIYDCSVLPAEADTAWHEDGDTPDDVTGILSVVDDPDIDGNKLIKVDSPLIAQEVWRMRWGADKDIGATLVMRCADIDPTAYDRGIDVYVQNDYVRERFVTKDGNRITLNKSGATTTLTTTDWHIYRITIIGNYIEVYVDEEASPYIDAEGDYEKQDNYFQFGDNGKERYGCYYDWIIWDVSGAYPPGEGTPIPQDLLETGTSDVSVTDVSTRPCGFRLSQNFPNPFNPTTVISLDLAKSGYTSLSVYNVLGQLVATLIDQYMNAGTYNETFDARNLQSGVYFYQIRSGDFTQVKKMILMK